LLKQSHTDYSLEFHLESPAREANMGVFAFHYNFKAATSVFPRQFMNRIGLRKARRMTAQDGHNAGTAEIGARAVPSSIVILRNHHQLRPGRKERFTIRHICKSRSDLMETGSGNSILRL